MRHLRDVEANAFERLSMRLSAQEVGEFVRLANPMIEKLGR